MTQHTAKALYSACVVGLVTIVIVRTVVLPLALGLFAGRSRQDGFDQK